MKHLNKTRVFVALLALVSTPLMAQNKGTDELVALKAQRDLAVKKSMAEIDKAYIVKLKELQKKAMAKQDLEGAIAVKDELTSLGVSSSDAANTKISPEALTKESADYIGKTFIYGNRKDLPVTLNADGTITRGAEPHWFAGKWEPVPGSKTKFQIINVDNGQPMVFVPSKGGTVYTAVSGGFSLTLPKGNK